MEYIPHQTIEIGEITIQVWGVMFALAIGLGLIWAYYRTPKELKDQTLNLGIINIVAGVIGARLAFVIFYPSGFRQIVDIFKVWDGGLISYGGLILGVFISIVYLKRNRLSVAQFVDIFAPPLALSTAITRIGCFLNHCHLGRLTKTPWGLDYLNEIRHPIALYYALSALIILVILLILEKRYTLRKGILGLTLGVLYPLGRLIADQFAEYQPAQIGIINNIFLIIVFIFFFYLLITRLQRR